MGISAGLSQAKAPQAKQANEAVSLAEGRICALARRTAASAVAIRPIKAGRSRQSEMLQTSSAASPHVSHVPGCGRTTVSDESNGRFPPRGLKPPSHLCLPVSAANDDNHDNQAEAPLACM
ncbi:hypothetical protein AAFF_G00045480 [Aldrovandia affinis]|uniref:Uncharacterized protein n=1 Tax=Aldrovandia affinis TaxID=143900 RepID=A0AAD7S253_9TELE|nr:hypothetical protein AAFF_G00045480 [Aldrovandia affinis]